MTVSQAEETQKYNLTVMSIPSSQRSRISHGYSQINRKSQLTWGRPVGYLHSTSVAKELNLGGLRTNQVSDKVGDLNPGPSDYKSTWPQ